MNGLQCTQDFLRHTILLHKRHLCRTTPHFLLILDKLLAKTSQAHFDKVKASTPMICQVRNTTSAFKYYSKILKSSDLSYLLKCGRLSIIILKRNAIERRILFGPHVFRLVIEACMALMAWRFQDKLMARQLSA